jgi:hypothetical protein
MLQHCATARHHQSSEEMAVACMPFRTRCLLPSQLAILSHAAPHRLLRQPFGLAENASLHSREVKQTGLPQKPQRSYRSHRLLETKSAQRATRLESPPGISYSLHCSGRPTATQRPHGRFVSHLR